MPSEYVIRQLTSEDEPILWNALSQGLHTAPGDAPPAPEVLHRPEFARYVEGWGRDGDRGFVAHDSETRDLLGAVWFREPPVGVAPELLFTVAPGARQRGIGAALLTRWVRTNSDQSEISLRVNAASPAVRLYERFGFRVVEDRKGYVTLRRV